jgi:hypothetical protein
MMMLLPAFASLLMSPSSPLGWVTCGGLPRNLSSTACPPTATCCHQKWAPGPGNWGCIDNAAWPQIAAEESWQTKVPPAAVCCANNYTACPGGHTCNDTGHGPMVVTDCLPAAGATGAVAGKQVCKQGAQRPFSTTRPNVLVVGDSVSIGYTPYVAEALAAEALVQHSPWGGDGGAEEAAYGAQCLDYLLRAPDGTALHPDVLMFNWGLHSRFPAGSTPIVPGQHGDPRRYAADLERIVEKLLAWAAAAPKPVIQALGGAVITPHPGLCYTPYACGSMWATVDASRE